MSSWIRACVGRLLMLLAAPRVASADLVWALTGDSRLVVFTVDARVNLGFDFNPQTDQIRIITSSEQNFRVSPVTGQVIEGDTPTAGIKATRRSLPSPTTSPPRTRTTSRSWSSGRCISMPAVSSGRPGRTPS